MSEPMTIRQGGLVTDVAICPDCEPAALAYQTRDYPERGLREFQCEQGHRSYRRWSTASVGRRHETPQQAAA